LEVCQSWGLFTISRRHRGFDPFAAALEKVPRDSVAGSGTHQMSPDVALADLWRHAAATKNLNSLRLVDTDPAAAQEATMEERKHEKEKHEAPTMLGMMASSERHQEATS
jgi:hypothetical protein